MTVDIQYTPITCMNQKNYFIYKTNLNSLLLLHPLVTKCSSQAAACHPVRDIEERS